MRPQMQLLINLSNANPAKDDTPEFYQSKVMPMLQQLSQQGYTDFNFRSLLGDTLVHICTYNRLPNTLKAIYKFCKDSNINLDLTLCDGKVGQTPIAIAAVMGNVALVNWFIEIAKEATTPYNPVWNTMRRRTDISEKYPVFFAAAFAGDEAIRKQLVERLDPQNRLRHLRDLNGVSAEYVMGHQGFVYPGTEESPVPRDCFGRTEFMMDVFRHNMDGIKAKLAACETDKEKFQLVNAKDYCGRSALIYACYMGFADMVDFLRTIADVDQADNCGQRPLHFAVLYAYRLENPSQIIQLLLDSDAQNLANHNELSPLDFAAIIESEPAQKLIRGAELQAQVLVKPQPPVTQRFEALVLEDKPTYTTTTTSPVSENTTDAQLKKAPVLSPKARTC